MSEARDIAKGHWREILPALGLDARFLQNRHGSWCGRSSMDKEI